MVLTDEEMAEAERLTRPPPVITGIARLVQIKRKTSIRSFNSSLRRCVALGAYSETEAIKERGWFYRASKKSKSSRGHW